MGNKMPKKLQKENYFFKTKCKKNHLGHSRVLVPALLPHRLQLVLMTMFIMFLMATVKRRMVRKMMVRRMMMNLIGVSLPLDRRHRWLAPVFVWLQQFCFLLLLVIVIVIIVFVIIVVIVIVVMAVIVIVISVVIVIIVVIVISVCLAPEASPASSTSP